MNFCTVKSVGSCPKCGGKLVGDGFASPIACEFADVPADTECDASPVWCNYSDDEDLKVTSL